MHKLIEFCIANWHYILTGCSCFISLIIFILKDKHNKKSINFLKLLSVIPAVINKAEGLFQMIPKAGSNKLEWVLSQLKIMCSELHLHYDEEKYKGIIEGYLSTPSKK